MAEKGFDEGLYKLDEFCTLLAETGNQLVADRTTLENLDAAMEQFESSVEKTLGALGDAVGEFQQGFGESGDDTSEEILALADTARRLADEGLAAAQEELVAAEDGVEEGLKSDESDLEQGFSGLDGEGFDPLSTTLDALEAAGTSLREELDQDFEELQGTLQQNGQRLDEAEKETADGLAQASSAFAGEETDGLDGDAAACVEGWGSEVPGTLEAQTAEFGQQFQRVYDDFESQAEADGQELATGVATLFEEAAGLAAETGARLEAALGEAMERDLGGLDEELGALRAVLDACEEVTAALDPIVDGLEIALRVVEDIDRLLNALE